MSPMTDRLEHLFSRYIDGECTAEERALVERLRRENPEVRVAFDRYAALDAMVCDVLCEQAHGAPLPVRPRKRWSVFGKGLGVAAAACVAAGLWLQPADVSSTPPRPPSAIPQHARAGHTPSWFLPASHETGPDLVEADVPRAFERPELRVRGTQRGWLVIPGDEPGTFLVIEVDRVQTRAIGIHQDF